MKRLTGMVLGMTGAIALQTAGLAQDRAILSAERAGLPPVVETRSELLITEPVSVNGPNQATKTLAPFNIYDATRLKEVTESLRAKPGSNGQGFDFLPPDLIHTPSFSSTDNSAIDFFQVPRPDPSVGINFNTQ